MTCGDCHVEIGRPYAKYCDNCRWRHRGKPALYVWTAEKDAFLRARYSSRERRCAETIGALWGWPSHAITQRARVLGLALSKEALGFRKWTAEEEQFLTQHAGHRHVDWMARKLKRSVTSVVVKLKRLHLSRRLDGYTQADVALAFGIDAHVVARWVSRGWLTAEHVAVERQPWRFTEDAIRAFIAEHRAAFDLRKVDQLWFLDLVLGPVSIADVARKGQAA